MSCFIGVLDFYSYLSASTGFLVAAFQLCQLTVSRAMPSVVNPDSAKIHQLRLVLYVKLSSYLFMAYQAIGMAITEAITTHYTKSLFSILLILNGF